MTLAILSSKIAAEQETSKVDGRCYNVRSQNKTKWEVYKLNQLQKKMRRQRKPNGLVRGVYSKEEMAEYKEIRRLEREAMVIEAEKRRVATASPDERAR